MVVLYLWEFILRVKEDSLSHNNVSQKIHKLVAQIAASQSAFQRNIVLQLANEEAARRYSAVWSVFTESVVDAAPIVVELLHDTNREVRLAAIAVCGRLQLHAATQHIMLLTQSPEIREQQAARQAMQDLHYHVVCDLLQQITCDDESIQQKIQQLATAATFHERTGRITSLAAQTSQDTFSIFVQLMEIPYTRLQCAIIKKLAKIPTAQNFLIEFLAQSSPIVRKELCNFYMKNAITQAIPGILNLLETDVHDKQLLIETLGELNASDAISSILKASQCKVAATALAKIYSNHSIVPSFLSDHCSAFHDQFIIATIHIIRKREIEQEMEDKLLLWEEDPQVDLSNYSEKVCGEMTIQKIDYDANACHVFFATMIEKDIEFTSTSLFSVEGVISFSCHHKPKTEYKSQTLISPP